jgi:hypothetical protein
MADIDCRYVVSLINLMALSYNTRIAAVASFPGLQRFHEGCNFRQWTGNDLKALMKVFIPAIKGHIPQDMVHAFHTLLEFCFLV